MSTALVVSIRGKFPCLTSTLLLYGCLVPCQRTSPAGIFSGTCLRSLNARSLTTRHEKPSWRVLNPLWLDFHARTGVVSLPRRRRRDQDSEALRDALEVG